MKAKIALVEGGAITLGVEGAGFTVDEVLLIGENSAMENTYHLSRNRPELKLTPPSAWESDDLAYLREGRDHDLDYMFLVPACSGLSRINRNASCDAAANIHFYRAFAIVDKLRPKCFTIENAPTLTTTGFPILKTMLDSLSEHYNFTILSDAAGRHGVAMIRPRTLVIGWRRDVFSDSIPAIDPAGEWQPKIKDVFAGLSENHKGSNVWNHGELTQVPCAAELPEALAVAVKNKTSLLRSIHTVVRERPELLKERFNEKQQREISRLCDKIDENTLKWDKSAAPLRWDHTAPSMTSLTRLIHPSGTRQASIREQARIMGFPDDFFFYEGGALNVIQCMAQGVPVPFVRWIASQCKKALTEDFPVAATRNDGAIVVYQNNKMDRCASLSRADFDQLTELRIESIDRSKVRPVPKHHTNALDFV